jgi:exodeoxyribonuclease VII large subunit
MSQEHSRVEHPIIPDSPSRVYSVSELTREIKETLEENFPRVWVQGEISNCHLHSSGHLYFTLKDERSQIRAVMFRSQVRQLAFEPENGMHVLCLGRVGVYEARGEYQLYLDFLEPRGLGALQKAFEQLKARLQEEGLFDPARKRPLPFLPRRIGIVTSPTGAVIRDMLHVLGRRFPNLHVLLRPAKVQGEGAAQEIVEGIEDLNGFPGVDLIVVARGGGSLEDLWAFNEEIVARAIAGSAIPVVSAVGHEVDYTIADFVADLRAPTPSAAAELIVPVKREIQIQLADLRENLTRCSGRLLRDRRDELRSWTQRLPDPRRRMADLKIFLDDLQGRVALSIGNALGRAREALTHRRSLLHQMDPRVRMRAHAVELESWTHRLLGATRSAIHEKRAVLEREGALLHSVSPLSVLGRGYSITRLLPSEEIVRDADQLGANDRVRITFHRGEADCRVEPRRKTRKRPT